MSFNRQQPPSRKRGYTTFKREVEEGGQEVIDLDGDGSALPPMKKRKRTIEVIDFTQNDSGDDEDKPIFSPASERDRKYLPFTSAIKTSTCMSCDETKSKDAFIDAKQDTQSLAAFGGAICRRCWEASLSAERAIVAQKKEQECSICYDTVPAHAIPTSPHGGARNHTVCTSCWERHLHTEIERKAWDKLTCPQDSCGQVLTYGEIAVLDERFERAIEPILAAQATASYLKQDKAYFACPSATCKSGNFLGDNDEDVIFTCEACDFVFCLACEVPMHTGKSCEDYQDSIHGDSRRRAEEAASKKLVDGTYKTCPNKKCGSKLELMSGCDHVVCLHCKRKFNWSSVRDPAAGQRQPRSMADRLADLDRARFPWDAGRRPVTIPRPEATPDHVARIQEALQQQRQARERYEAAMDRLSTPARPPTRRRR